jgi:hypothetical protein
VLFRYGGKYYHAHFAGEFGFDRFLSIHLSVCSLFPISPVRIFFPVFVVSKYTVRDFILFYFLR